MKHFRRSYIWENTGVQFSNSKKLFSIYAYGVK